MSSQQPSPLPELIRLSDFAEAISVSTRQVYRMIDKGEVPKPVKQGSVNFFFREDLERHLERLRDQRR